MALSKCICLSILDTKKSGIYDFNFLLLDAQLFFLTIAKKNRTRIARVIEDDKISIIGKSPSKKVSSIDSNNNWTAKREKAIAANIIFFRPVLLYAKIDNANKRREKTPIIAWIALSTPSNKSVCRFWKLHLANHIIMGVTSPKPMEVFRSPKFKYFHHCISTSVYRSAIHLEYT